MREFCFKLFSKSWFDTGLEVTAFSISHIAYLVLIFGGIIAGYFLLRGKPEASKVKALRVLAYCVTISYLADFFFHDFVYGGMEIDKLPFHICTVLCPLMAIAQFNRNGKKIVEPVVILSILAPMMYICYPASIGSGEPWCYKAAQTMFYHGTLMAWGILSIALGQVKPKFRNCWKVAVLLVCITVWAKLGNEMLGNNWFFLQEDAFYIGLVEMGIIPQWSLMIINPIVFFLAALAVYGVCAIFCKKETKEPVAV